MTTAHELMVLMYSKKWWGRKKPENWTDEEHLKNPEVNCITMYEKKLARAVAALILEEIKEGGR